MQKNEKVLETLIQIIRIYSQDVGMEFVIEKCPMLKMKSEKRESAKSIELPNQESIRMLGEKENYKYREGKKKKKIVSQKIEKVSRNQTLLQGPHQRD